MLLTQIGANKSRGKDAGMFSGLIYLFAPFSIFHIPHNYVIPQAMPHAIPQTHSSFYAHAHRTNWFINPIAVTDLSVGAGVIAIMSAYDITLGSSKDVWQFFL